MQFKPKNGIITVPYGTPQYALQRHNAQDRDRTTKRSKIRTVDFCDTLAAILRTAKIEQHKNRLKYGELYKLNYCKTVTEKGRNYHEVYSIPRTDKVPEDCKELSFVCLRPDGAYESPSTVGIMCKRASKKV